MQIRRAVFALLVLTAMSAFFLEHSAAQAPKGGAKAAPAPKATAAARPATLGQLMKGILYPNSNVIFAVQSQDPTKLPPAKDAATATDPLVNAYGKWEAVENAGLAIAEAATLLTLPGRKCSNGRDVPIGNADWAKLVQGVRAAGLVSYRAAQAKDMDKILDAADQITTACSNCHDKYREVTTRCM